MLHVGSKQQQSANHWPSSLQKTRLEGNWWPWWPSRWRISESRLSLWTGLLSGAFSRSSERTCDAVSWSQKKSFSHLVQQTGGSAALQEEVSFSSAPQLKGLMDGSEGLISLWCTYMKWRAERPSNIHEVFPHVKTVGQSTNQSKAAKRYEDNSEFKANRTCWGDVTNHQTARILLFLKHFYVIKGVGAEDRP